MDAFFTWRKATHLGEALYKEAHQKLMGRFC